jgi:outer membrane protein TolC
MRQSAPLSKVWKLRVARCSSAPSATLGLLTTQNTYQTALVALVLAQAARYTDTAALFQALGGC